MTLARLMATAAPTAAAPPLAAEPSALALALVLPVLVSVSAPPALTETVEGRLTCELALSMLTAIAAATAMPPPEVEADGVAVPPEPVPPLAVAVVSANPRASAACPSTPPKGDPGAPEPGAPAAEALAWLPLIDVPFAAKLTAPPAASDRDVVAETAWLAIVSASDAPTAAVEAPLATAPEIVETDAVCDAVAPSAPPILVRDPAPSEAVVVTFEIDTDTAGVTATAPAAPILASVVIESVVLAARERLAGVPVRLPVRLEVVASVTKFTATEAPSPRLDAVVPAPKGSALAVELDVVVAVSAASPPAIAAAPASTVSV